MNPIDQFFNFAKRCEHALVNLHPDFALMFIKTGIVAAFLHAVYCGNHFYAQVLLPCWQIPPSERLVASTASAPARKSSSATRTTAATTAITTGFLWTSLVDLERSTFHV